MSESELAFWGLLALSAIFLGLANGGYWPLAEVAIAEFWVQLSSALKRTAELDLPGTLPIYY